MESCSTSWGGQSEAHKARASTEGCLKRNIKKEKTIWITTPQENRNQLITNCYITFTSAVPARLGLKAPALAWPEVALASSNARPGQSHLTWLGLGLAWPRPRLFGICISTNKFNSFFHKLLHSKSNQSRIQKTSITSVYTIPQTKKNSKWNFFKIFDENLIGLNPWPEPAALAFQNTRPGQSHHKAVILAWLSLAYLGLAWPGSQPQARPCTALLASLRMYVQKSD